MTETPDLPHDPSQELVVPAGPLRELLVSMLVKKGMFAVEAESAADRLVEADLRGIHSHGSRAIVRYLKSIDEGDIDPRGQVTTIRETAAMAVLDGGRNLGHVAATKAMQLAIDKAKAVGTGTVAVRNSQHYGAAGVYALMAVDAGLIGYTTTSTAGASIAAYGSRRAAVANHAFAWGIPVRSGPPFVLDMACGISAWGKIETLGMYGLDVPENWTLDVDGHPTCDPKAAKIMLPAAGARGFGLAFVSSMLAGPLVGAKMPLHKTRKPPVDGSEHFFYAIDVESFVEPDLFHEELASTMADIRALPPAEGFDRVRLPGELEWERSQRFRREGIPIHRDHAARLEEAAHSMKLDVPW